MVLFVLGITSTASAGETVKIGTLAPKKSAWGKVFNAWSKAVKKKSKGKLELKWYYNGSQGDEGAMINKMKSGQLDGAAVTSVGLSKINTALLSPQLPGLCAGKNPKKVWKCIDGVRDAVRSDFQSKAKAAGFLLAGDGDVGLAHTFTKGLVIKSPNDLDKNSKTGAKAKVYGWSEDPMLSVVSGVLNYTPVKKSVPELLPAISSGAVNVATVPALPCEQLQWCPYFDHVSENIAAAAIGGLVFSKSKVDGLPGDLKDMLTESGEKAGKMLTKRIRKYDQKAYKRARKKMTVVEIGKVQEYKWKNTFKKIRKKLGQEVFTPELVAKMEAAAGK
jgi:TRAP-type C4-dicarboxylate transport system substrate-binding protein